MEKYVINIKDLVTQVLTNGSEIKSKAEKGDALSCFKMGMINLLGINTQIDFKKASAFLGDQSLSDVPNAKLLLGFIAECDGDFSSAFMHYADAAGETGKDNDRPIYNKVFEERRKLQVLFKTMGLPTTVLNKKLSEILDCYAKGGDSKVDASIMIATICDDEYSCIEAARNLYNIGDYYSAKKWLQKGNIGNNNPLFVSVENKYSESISPIELPDLLKIVNINGGSLLTDYYSLPSIAESKESCNRIALSCKKEWQVKAKSQIDEIKEKIDQEEKERIKRQKEADYQAYLQQYSEEEEEKRRRTKIIRYVLISVALIGLLGFLLLSSGGSSSNGETTPNEINQEVVPTSIEESTNTDKDIKDSDFSDLLHQKKLTDSDLEGKTKKDLEIMRNSIYARYGYKFKRNDLLEYFSQFSWYNPTTSDMSIVYNSMSDIEKYNIEFIKKHE